MFSLYKTVGSRPSLANTCVDTHTYILVIAITVLIFEDYEKLCKYDDWLKQNISTDTQPLVNDMSYP